MISLLNKTLELLEKESTKILGKQRLQKLFILELRYNLGLLDTTKWKSVNDEFKFKPKTPNYEKVLFDII